MKKNSTLKSRDVHSVVLVLCVFFAIMFSSCGDKKAVISDTDNLPPPSVPVTDKTVPAGPVTDEQVKSLIEVVSVNGGLFAMGFPTANRRSFNGEGIAWPRHNVTVKNFYIGKYEVTQGQYYEVTGMNPSENNRNPENSARDGWKTLPVEYISWYEALVFCNRLSIKEKLKPVYNINGNVEPDEWGDPPEKRRVAAWDAVKMDQGANGYRLPTEAEWEFAAQGGMISRNFVYSGSNVAADVAWYEPSKDGQIRGNVHGVGQKQANELGLYDMSGNIMEWCWDWDGNYPSDAQDNPVGPPTGTHRIIRGGSWSTRDTFCVVRARHKNDPFSHAINLGFRVARNK